jgi:hypothetical protein
MRYFRPPLGRLAGTWDVGADIHVYDDAVVVAWPEEAAASIRASGRAVLVVAADVTVPAVPDMANDTSRACCRE